MIRIFHHGDWHDADLRHSQEPVRDHDLAFLSRLSLQIILVRRIDWHTLIFFAAMFVLMDAVWRTGVIQGWLAESGADVRSPAVVLGVSVGVSQFVSNVPLVALSLPMIQAAGGGTAVMMALAAGSTLAGNLFILGAACNVIVIQNAEKRAKETLTFWEFSRVGIPLTIVNAAIVWLFL